MASTQAKAMRRADALGRLSTALNIEPADLDSQAKGDPVMALVMTLERVADAVEAQAQPQGNDLRAAVQAATDEELTAIPGIGAKSVEALRAWANEPAAADDK